MPTAKRHVSHIIKHIHLGILIQPMISCITVSEMAKLIAEHTTYERKNWSEHTPKDPVRKFGIEQGKLYFIIRFI